MTHLPFTILAYLFNATAVTIDKFLLTKHISNPLVYVFYFSVFSLLGLFLLPFTQIPSLSTFILASLSTLIWTGGAYFMFKALQIGQVARVIPVIGTLIPIFLLIQAVMAQTIKQQEILAVLILLLGLVFLTILDWRGKFTRKELALELLSASLFALSYIILRQAYLQNDFLTVLAWSRFILIPVGLTIVIIPVLRKIVFSDQAGKPSFKILSKAGLLFLIGQSFGGLSELLITFSISLATPALVNSLQGSQYIFLFFFSLVLARKFPQIYQEKTSSLYLLTKVLGILFIGGGLYLLAK